MSRLRLNLCGYLDTVLRCLEGGRFSCQGLNVAIRRFAHRELLEEVTECNGDVTTPGDAFAHGSAHARLHMFRSSRSG